MGADHRLDPAADRAPAVNRALFIGGPLDGEVHEFDPSSRLVCAEYPEEMISCPWPPPEPPPEFSPFPRRVVYRVGKFGRSDEQWIWVGYAGTPPDPATVWRAFLAPGIREAMQR
jgi:hypothetical protein